MIGFRDRPRSPLPGLRQVYQIGWADHIGGVATRVLRATDRLEDFPQMGRVVPEIDRDDIREIIVQSYRIIYRLLLDEVDILTVHH